MSRVAFTSLLVGALSLGGLAHAEPQYQMRVKVGGLEKKLEAVGPGLSHTFTSCGNEGRSGPSQSQCQTAYQGSDVLSEPFSFSVQIGIQSFKIPGDGNYRITAYGPTGVNVNDNVGKGAVIQAEFNLDAASTVWILVGQKSVYAGTHDWQGGSGGTFVAIGENYSSAQPVIVAGGGGTNRSETSSYNSTYGTYGTVMTASTGTSGKSGSGSAGGINGSASAGGGHRGDLSGSGAAGFYGSARSAAYTKYGGPYQGSGSFSAGGVGGDFIGGDGNAFNGGFGGGGPGGWGGAGGGGGYSGGGNSHNGGFSGGGGSFISSLGTEAATSDGQFQITGQEPTPAYTGAIQNLGTFNSGAGKVVIEKL